MNFLGYMGKLSLRRFIPLFLFLAFCVAPRYAAPWYQGLTIKSIVFSGEHTVKLATLNDIASKYVGKKYNLTVDTELQNDLYGLEYFNLVTIDVSKAPGTAGGIILKVKLQERPSVVRVIYKGNKKIKTAALKEVVLIKPGDIAAKAKVRSDARSIKALYMGKGYLDATVNGMLITDKTKNTSQVVFTIKEGLQTTIAAIIIKGNKIFKTSTLLNQMKTKKAQAFHKGILKQSVFRDDLSKLVAYYANRGFINAKIVSHTTKIIKDKKGRNRMIITITLSEGARYLYGGLTVSGNTLFSTANILAIVPMERGDVFNKALMDKAISNITDKYLELGYIYNTFNTTSRRDEATKTIFYTMKITERPRGHIGKIIIKGNTKTADYVIYRELPFAEGEIFSKKKLMEGLANLYKTDYFKKVTPEVKPTNDPGLMDVVLTVEEKQTINIYFSLSISGGDDFPLSGGLKLSDSNFLGQGLTFGGAANFSPTSQDFSLNFSSPWLAGQRVTLGTTFSYSHSSENTAPQDLDGNGVPDPYTSWDEYEASDETVPDQYEMQYSENNFALGVNSGYSWVLPDFSRVGIFGGYTMNFSYIYYNSDIFSPFDKSIRENHDSWLFNDVIYAKFVFDSRDIPSEPTKGVLFTEKISYGGLTPLANQDYIQYVTRIDTYYPLIILPITDSFSFKMIFRFQSALSYLGKNFTGNGVDVDQNGFYIDGFFIGRGWDVETGGKILWDNRAEIHFPILGSIGSIDFFLDMVGLWANNRDFAQMQSSDFRMDVGGGIRLTSQFPIAFYVVKKFKVMNNGDVDWNPESNTTLGGSGINLVITFNLDPYQ